MSGLRQLSERGLAPVAHEGPRFQDRLSEMHDLCAYFEQEIPALLERWEQQRKPAELRS